MQEFDWNTLKVLRAVERTGTLSGAAVQLGMDETTVSRRLKALQRAVELPLFSRDQGRYRPTDVAAPIFALAERFELESLAIAESIQRHERALKGRVRVSAVPFVINHILVPGLQTIKAVAPDLTVELVADNRNIKLDRREADVALRFARPNAGGLSVQAKRIGEIEFVASAPAGSDPLGWITYGAEFRDLPQAQAVEELRGTEPPALVVADLETAAAAVAEGVGRSLLPASVVRSDTRIRRIPIEHELPKRDVWMLTSRDAPERAAVTAVKNWLTNLERW